MRTKNLLLFLLGWAGMAFGQEEIKVDGNYYFNYPSKENLNAFSNETGLDQKTTLSEIQSEIQGSRFRVKVISITDGTVNFIFGDFDEPGLQEKINNQSNLGDKKSTYLKQLEEIFSNNQNNENLKKLMGELSNNSSKIIKGKKGVYSLPLDKFILSTKPLYNRVDWRVGVYTVPFKLRFGDFNFDANVNLGANLGAKIRWNREIENSLAFEPIFGFGLASIQLDDSNSSIESPTNISAFTINTGVLIHITNAINVGLTYGFDNISKNDQNNYNWKYNGKGWLGIGINISFSGQDDNTGDL